MTHIIGNEKCSLAVWALVQISIAFSCQANPLRYLMDCTPRHASFRVRFRVRVPRVLAMVSTGSIWIGSVHSCPCLPLLLPSFIWQPTYRMSSSLPDGSWDHDTMPAWGFRHFGRWKSYGKADTASVWFSPSSQLWVLGFSPCKRLTFLLTPRHSKNL